MAKKKSTASKMGSAVKKAAKKVTKALGLTGRKKAGAKKAGAKKAGAKKR
jgi:hypothetical protein